MPTIETRATNTGLDLGSANVCRRERAVDVWHQTCWQATTDVLAEEVPVALVYNGLSHAVMLATPADLEDFARGFTLTEGILPRDEAISEMRLERHLAGLVLSMRIPSAYAARLHDQTRALPGRSGCGLCGSRHLESALRWPRRTSASARFSSAAVQRARAALSDLQALNATTGAVHAAAWADADGRITLVREDVGRHNALDKLVGALLATGTDGSEGFVIVTSRASYEMVQKTAAAGIGCLVAVSAPTALAARMAEAAGITLLGFARQARHVCYAHPWRLDDAPATLRAAGQESAT